MDNVCFQEMPLRVIMVGAMPALTKNPGFEEFSRHPRSSGLPCLLRT